MTTSLKLDVYVAPPISVAFQPPGLPDGYHFEWSPMAVALIWCRESKEAAVIDALMTDKQGNELADWIESTAPGVSLKYIFITHGHGDHAFGMNSLLKRFPSAKVLATPGTIEHMKQQVSPSYFNAVLGAWFPGQIDITDVMLKLAPIDTGTTFEVGGEKICVMEAGQSDTSDSSFVWVPSLEAAICGDVVYNGVHQMVSESNTTELRKQWIDGVRKVAALKPKIVVSGHTKPGNEHSPNTLEETIEYLQRYSEITENSASAPELFEGIMKAYPDRMNSAMVWIGSHRQAKFS
jgi:glyoxylase-like metal-dependent hydrolase (beta-lactamase superfamily II)